MKLLYLFYGAIVATTLQLKSAEQKIVPTATGGIPQPNKLEQYYEESLQRAFGVARIVSGTDETDPGVVLAEIHRQSGLAFSEVKKTKDRFGFFMMLSGLPGTDPKKQAYDAYVAALSDPTVSQETRDKLETVIDTLQKQHVSKK